MNEQSHGLNVIIIVLIIIAIGVIGYYFGKSYSAKEADQTVEQIQDETVQNAQEVTKENCLADECLEVENLEYPVGDLPADVIAALDEAINDEYKAHATYDKVIETLGSIRPFAMIIGAEEQHIASLKAIYDKYGVEVPADTWLDSDKVTYYSTKAENCQLGVDAEIANYQLYENQLLPVVANYPDIIEVFTQLKDASKNNHLPAFEKCK